MDRWFLYSLAASSILLVGCGRIGFDPFNSPQDAATQDGTTPGDVISDVASDIATDSLVDGASDTTDGSLNCGANCSTVQQWAKRFGDTDYDWGIAVDTDSNDNVYLGGMFSGTVDFGGGPLNELPASEIIVASFDPTGAHRWSNVPTGPSGGGPWFIYDLAVDSTEGVVFTGKPSPSGNNEAFLMTSYDSNGTYRWGTHNADSLDWVGFGAVAADNQNHTYITGFLAGTYDFGCGALSSNGNTLDVFVLSLNSTTGVCLWSYSYGAAGIQDATDIAVQADGTVFITGYFNGSFSAGGATLSSVGNYDIFVASYTNTGAHRWSFSLGSTQGERGRLIALNGDQHVLIAGTFGQSMDFGTGTLTPAGAEDVYIASYSTADGQPLWSTRLGGTSNDSVEAIQVNPSGGVHVCGNYSGTVDFGDAQRTSQGDTDVFVAAYETATGAPLASRSYGDTGTDSCNDLTFDAAGAMYLTGNFSGTVDFDGTTLISQGSQDIFLTKTGPVWSCDCP